MAYVHRVIILNKPLKIRGYTPFQWFLFAVAGGLAVAAFSYTPKEMKLLNMPLGILLAILIACVALVFVGMTQMKPLVWWKNKILFALGQIPRRMMPITEAGTLYPDPTIQETVQREDNYIS